MPGDESDTAVARTSHEGQGQTCLLQTDTPVHSANISHPVTNLAAGAHTGGTESRGDVTPSSS